MPRAIHPKYEESTVTCACGETFTTCSTKSVIKVEVCSKCHQAYTGEKKTAKVAGRIEQFMNKLNSVKK